MNDTDPIPPPKVIKPRYDDRASGWAPLPHLALATSTCLPTVHDGVVLSLRHGAPSSAALRPHDDASSDLSKHPHIRTYLKWPRPPGGPRRASRAFPGICAVCLFRRRTRLFLCLAGLGLHRTHSQGRRLALVTAGRSAWSIPYHRPWQGAAVDIMAV